MMLARTLRTFLFAAATALWLGCAQGGGGEQETAGPPPRVVPPERALNVGTTGNYPPLSFLRDGQLSGLEIDFAWRVAEAMGKEPVFHQMEFDQLISALQSGQVDVLMAGMSVTPKRSEQVAFIKPYMRVGQMALIRERDLPRFGRPTDLYRPEARVGYKTGTTGEKFVRANLPQGGIQGFATSEQGVLALRTGTIDFFIHDAPTIWRYALAPAERDLMGLYAPLTEEYLAWAVRKDDVALKRSLDDIIQTWADQERLRPMVDRWVPIRVELK